MGNGTKMEVSNLQKLNNDGYLYAPKIIMDPKNLYFPPPKDENNNNKTGALVYEGDEPKMVRCETGGEEVKFTGCTNKE